MTSQLLQVSIAVDKLKLLLGFLQLFGNAQLLGCMAASRSTQEASEVLGALLREPAFTLLLLGQTRLVPLAADQVPVSEHLTDLRILDQLATAVAMCQCLPGSPAQPSTLSREQRRGNQTSPAACG